jgi:Transposase DDE domain
VPYWASPKDCRACALKPRCTKGQKRIVTRNFFEAEREHVRALKGTEAFERSARERRRIEMLFAHLKRNLNSRRLRGITGAADEFLLAATKPEEIGPIYRRAPGNNGRQARLSRTIISLHETDLSHQWISTSRPNSAVASLRPQSSPGMLRLRRRPSFSTVSKINELPRCLGVG